MRFIAFISRCYDIISFDVLMRLFKLCKYKPRQYLSRIFCAAPRLTLPIWVTGNSDSHGAGVSFDSKNN